MASDNPPPATLRVEREAKIADVLGAAAAGLTRLEASGVLVHDDALWVIFDNLPHVARLHPSLAPNHPDTFLYRFALSGGGYEDIAMDRDGGVFFLLIESQPAPGGGLMARTREFDLQFHELACRWLDVPIERPNKGIEGLSFLCHEGRRYLLGLPEGNGGHGGKRGRRHGDGLIHVFTEDDTVARSPAAGTASWALLTTVHLPRHLPFTDYSGLSYRNGRLAVVSQESSLLWAGRIDPATWTIVDKGRTYRFPRSPHGKIRYGTIEGVSWLSDRLLAVVSDRCKRRQPKRMRSKDQSVHVVSLPDG